VTYGVLLGYGLYPKMEYIKGRNFHQQNLSWVKTFVHRNFYNFSNFYFFEKAMQLETPNSNLMEVFVRKLQKACYSQKIIP